MRTLMLSCETLIHFAGTQHCLGGTQLNISAKVLIIMEQNGVLKNLPLKLLCDVFVLINKQQST